MSTSGSSGSSRRGRCKPARSRRASCLRRPTRIGPPSPTSFSRTTEDPRSSSRRSHGCGRRSPRERGRRRERACRYHPPVRFRAVFFDAGETLVHPHPSFTELFAQVLRREGFEVDEAAVAAKVHVIGERFSEAARDDELWTTSPSRSQAFWLSVYERFLEALEVPGPPE